MVRYQLRCATLPLTVAVIVLVGVAGAGYAKETRYCPTAIDPITCADAAVDALIPQVDACLALPDKRSFRKCVRSAKRAFSRENKRCAAQKCPDGQYCIDGLCEVAP